MGLMANRTSDTPLVSRPTLSAVAKRAGTSPATVSAVLSDRPGSWASPVTREKVIAAAAELGYRPNLAARSLRGARTNTIGLLTAALDIEVTTRKMQAFEQAAREAGYITLFCFNPNFEPDTEDRLLQTMEAHGVDGVAVFPIERGRHRVLKDLVQRGFPVVTIDGAFCPELNCDDVSFDYRAAGRMQAEHLISIGRRHPAQLRTVPSCFATDQLRQGFLEGMQACGAEPPHCIDLAFSESINSAFLPDLTQRVQDALAPFFRDGVRIDAIASHDRVCALAMLALRDLGYNIPEDVAVIGMDDGQLAMNCLPTLTTLAQPTNQLARAAFRLIEHRMQGGGHTQMATRMAIAPELKRRSSA